jgi:hypothetical protein
MQEPIDATRIWRIAYADQELMRQERDVPCGNVHLGTITHRIRLKPRVVCAKRAKKLRRLGESVQYDCELKVYRWTLVVGLHGWQRHERRTYRNNPEYQRNLSTGKF